MKVAGEDSHGGGGGLVPSRTSKWRVLQACAQEVRCNGYPVEGEGEAVDITHTMVKEHDGACLSMFVKKNTNTACLAKKSCLGDTPHTHTHTSARTHTHTHIQPLY